MTREEAYILGLLKQYAKSPEGKAKIKEMYGIDYKERIGDKDFLYYGNLMKKILYEKASGVIKSMNVDDIIVGAPTQGADGMWTLTIEFDKEKIHRDSLLPHPTKTSAGYPDGFDDIVLLFSKGYHARDYVYGDWHGKRIRSRLSRKPNNFLEEAVKDFNVETKGAAYAELTGKYNPNYVGEDG